MRALRGGSLGSRPVRAGGAVNPVRVLEKQPIFKSVSAARRKALARASRLLRYEPGQFLCRQGSRGRHMFVVVEGEAEVYRVAPKGVRLSLAVLGRGEVFGELSLIDGAPREAHVVARTPTLCLAIPRKEFRELLAKDPGLGEALVRVLAERLRHVDRRVLL